MKISLAGHELLHVYGSIQHSLMSYHRASESKKTPYLIAVFIQVCNWHISICCWGWTEERKWRNSLCKICTTSIHTKIFYKHYLQHNVMQRGQEIVHSCPFGTKVKYEGSYISLPHMPSQCAEGEAFIYI